MNKSHQRLALNYILDVTIIAYLQAFKYTSGSCNPNNEVKISTPVHQYWYSLLRVTKIKPAEPEPPLPTVDMIKITCCKPKKIQT